MYAFQDLCSKTCEPKLRLTFFYFFLKRCNTFSPATVRADALVPGSFPLTGITCSPTILALTFTQPSLEFSPGKESQRLLLLRYIGRPFHPVLDVQIDCPFFLPPTLLLRTVRYKRNMSAHFT